MTDFITHNLWILVIIAIAIVAALASYAVVLLQRLKKQTKNIQNIQDDRLLSMKTSITTICDATLQQQCSVSEATVRIVNLIQLHTRLTAQFKDRLPKSHEFYQKIEHHPILDNRKQTPKNVLRKLDAEREELESLYESDILKELQWLKEQF